VFSSPSLSSDSWLPSTDAITGIGDEIIFAEGIIDNNSKTKANNRHGVEKVKPKAVLCFKFIP
jgi:hypothetical protein